MYVQSTQLGGSPEDEPLRRTSPDDDDDDDYFGFREPRGIRR
jgi:hypothetical protein